MNALARFPRSISFLFWMTVLTGVLYPAAITLVAQLAFPGKANGSLVTVGGQIRGSALLAQKFESPRYFRERPSASDYAYVGSGASNQGPVSASLAQAVHDRGAAWKQAFGTEAGEDMLYASGSGLDPETSLESALAQIGSISAARGLASSQTRELEAALREAARSSTGLIGPPRINVLSMNLLLDSDRRFSDGKK
jgi:potassium-transporting ATPase KdpC subunit